MSKLGLDLGSHLRCKWPISGSHFARVKFIFNKLWEVIFRKFQGKSSGKVRGKFVSKSGLDLVGILRCKWPVSGPEFTHVNLFSINYGGWFGGDLQGKLLVKFGPNLVPIWVAIYSVNWPVSGSHFAHVNYHSGNYGRWFAGRFGSRNWPSFAVALLAELPLFTAHAFSPKAKCMCL